jgi:hypothetical protein
MRRKPGTKSPYPKVVVQSLIEALFIYKRLSFTVNDVIRILYLRFVQMYYL